MNMLSILTLIASIYILLIILCHGLLGIRFKRHSLSEPNRDVFCDFRNKYSGCFDLVINPSSKTIYKSKTSALYRIKKTLIPIGINSEAISAIDIHQSRCSFYVHNKGPAVFVLTSDARDPLFSLRHEAAHAMMSKERLVGRLCGDGYAKFENIFFLFTLYCTKNGILPREVEEIDKSDRKMIYILIEECICDLYAVYESDGRHIVYLRELRKSACRDDKTHNTLGVVEEAFDANYQRASPVKNLEKAFSGVMWITQKTNTMDAAIENLVDS